MFVLGIDPGLSRCGYGAVLKIPGGFKVHSGGVLCTEVADPLPKRLFLLQSDMRSLLDDLRPDVVAVERVFFQTNVRTAMATAMAAGIALAAAQEHDCEIAQYTSNEVKMAVVGYGAASKEQVQRMVAHLLALESPPRPPDVADALALAVCHLSSSSLKQSMAAALLGGSKK